MREREGFQLVTLGGFKVFVLAVGSVFGNGKASVIINFLCEFAFP